MAAPARDAARGVPIVVFNPLSWSRTGPVDADSPFPGENPYVALVDEQGKVVPGQNMGDRLQFTAREVPPLGCKVYWAKRIPNPLGNPIKTSASTVENQYFRVQVDSTLGVISDILDKVNNRHVVPYGSALALLQVCSKGNGTKKLVGGSEVVVMQRGPAVGLITFDHENGDSRFTQEIKLYDSVPRVDMRSTVDWDWGVSKNKSVLEVVFSTFLSAARKTLGNQLGSTEWNGGNTGICGVKWLDMSTSGYGVSVLSDTKQGFQASQGKVTLTLEEPSTPGEDIEEFVYSIYPHKGDWRGADTDKRSYELTYPLSARVVTSGIEPTKNANSYVTHSSPNIVLRLLREPGKDGSVVLRFYETQGKITNCRVKLYLPVKSAVETDQFEKPIATSTPVDGDVFSVKLLKHQIRTFKLQP
ncbi:MAG: glycoside hydrolase family 38 C-terminal domain-containing protein [Armatimonadota bacterium]